MASKPRATHFAPAGRAAPETIRRQADAIANQPLMAHLFNCIQEMLVILNAERQIVFANPRFLEFVGVASADMFLGMRPGEAVSCHRSSSEDAPDGCGTSVACGTCGAVRAILASQTMGSGLEECIIMREGKDDEPLNLKVRASQINIDGDEFTIFALQDISDSKRRAALERIFFHDVLNTAGAVRGMAQLLNIAKPDQQETFRQRIRMGTDRLIDEINSYRVIAAAECDELRPNIALVRTDSATKDAVSLFQGHDVCANKTLRIGAHCDSVILETDPALLSRVLVNMVKNALEATPAEGTVTVECHGGDSSVRFEIHNPTEIPRDVALQIFQRSFSTKAADRGLGTYSMKLIGERYLGGRVSFTTSRDDGTTFVAAFPTTFSGDFRSQ